jgi:hypothetical protein
LQLLSPPAILLADKLWRFGCMMVMMILISWQLICTIGLIIIGSISPAYHHGYIEGELLYTIGRLIFIIIPVRMCRIWIALERYIWIALDNTKNIPTGS